MTNTKTNTMLINLSKLIVGAIVMFFSPIAFMVLAVSIAVVADTVTGLIKTYNLKQQRSSRKLTRIVWKTLLYSLAIVFIYTLDILFLGGLMHSLFGISSTSLLATKFITLVLISIELYSVDENIRAFNQDRGFWYYYKKLKNTIVKIKSDINNIAEKHQEK